MAFSVADAFLTRGIPAFFAAGIAPRSFPDAYTPEALRELDALEQTTAFVLE